MWVVLVLSALAQATPLRSQECIPHWKSCHFIEVSTSGIKICSAQNEDIEGKVSCANDRECAALSKTAECSAVTGRVEDSGHGRRVTFDFDVDLDFHQAYLVSGTILPNNSFPAQAPDPRWSESPGPGGTT